VSDLPGNKPPAPPAPPPPPDRKAIARRSKSLSDEALFDECDWDVFVASGPGGQHRNKTESGVRLVHRPTGITVTATERRSQHENKGHAIDRLRERLEQLAFVPKKRRPTKPTRGSQERRLTAKKQASQVKRQRRDKDW
jgi:ribosome-associated protein